MKLPKYPLKAEQDLTIFEFISKGTKGRITKLIVFEATNLNDFYNLAFGDKDITSGKIDDSVVSNNGDTEKVLATVVAAVYAFTDKYPEAWVYVTGSTASRTRLYRMGINKYLSELKTDFHVFGELENEWQPYKKDNDFIGFVVKRK